MYSVTLIFQVSALDGIKQANPESIWWISGVDVVKGLFESTKGVWSGDVDLNDGQLERKFKEMHDRLLFVKDLGLSSRSGSVILMKDLEVLLEYSKEDSKFILHGRNLKNTKTKALFLNEYFVIVELQIVNQSYENKLKSGGAANNTMFALCWDIHELTQLKDNLQEVRVEIASTLEIISVENSSVNLPKRLGVIREKFAKIIKGVTRFRRVPATHMFVIMLSCELRDHKPYAIPIQCLPCVALKECDIRRIITNVLKEMTVREMKVRG